MTDPDQTRAAGVVLWRAVDDHLEIGVVHRPRYDDWTHPKGKLDAGEPRLAASARETLEETGHRVRLGRLVGSVAYQVSTGAGGRVAKTVDYFSGESTGGGFHPNDEVDELRWVGVEEAARLLSYPFDREVLAAFAAGPLRPSTLVLLRHAKAGKRGQWTGDDALRPLSPAGWAQVGVLRQVLPLLGPTRVCSAPRVRCVQTVANLAGDLGVELGEEPLLAEEAYQADPAGALARARELADGDGPVVVASQGGVIPGLVGGFAEAGGPALADIRSRKASFWVLSFDPDSRLLIAADYHEIS